MKNRGIKKGICLVLILGLILGLVHRSIATAEEISQIKTETQKIESSDEQSKVLKEYVLPILLIPLQPIAIGLAIICLLVSQDFSKCIGK